MKSKYLFILLALPCIAILSACLPDINMASSSQTIEISKPYAFATVPGARTAAAFMTIQNNGEVAEKLIGAESSVAGIVEIHQNMIDPDDGTMMMRKIKGLDLGVGEEVVLEPKGYHIMFLDLQESLAIGQTFNLTLLLESGSVVKTKVQIVPPGSTPK